MSRACLIQQQTANLRPIPLALRGDDRELHFVFGSGVHTCSPIARERNSDLGAEPAASLKTKVDNLNSRQIARLHVPSWSVSELQKMALCPETQNLRRPTLH